MTSLVSRFRSVASRRFVRNTGSVFLGQAGRVALQGAYFVIVARALGVQDFGAFAGGVALASMIAPFGSLGAVQLMIRHIVRDRSVTASQFATATMITTLSGTAVLGVLGFAARWVAPPQLPVQELMMIAAADLLCARLVEVAGSVYAATQQMFRAAQFQLWFSASRLTGALALGMAPVDFTLTTWGTVYLASSALPMLVVQTLVRRDVGSGRPDIQQYAREWREGIFFSVGLASQSVYNDIDKAMLAKLSTLEATGIYSAAYRVIDMAYTPMRALLGAAYPRFFMHGAQGLRPALAFTKRLFIPGVGYCVFAAIALVACAELVPYILGHDYDDSVGALRALAILPVLKALHYLASDTLTGAGFQGLRSGVQLGIAALNVALNLALIPVFGYWGAVTSSLLSDGLLAILMWSVVVAKLRSVR